MIVLVIIMTMAVSLYPQSPSAIVATGKKSYETREECEEVARRINLLDPYETGADMSFVAYCVKP